MRALDELHLEGNGLFYLFHRLTITFVLLALTHLVWRASSARRSDGSVTHTVPVLGDRPLNAAGLDDIMLLTLTQAPSAQFSDPTVGRAQPT